MELRPFRGLRYSPRILAERGLDALIAPPVSPAPNPASVDPPAPENISRLTLAARGDGGRAAGAAETLRLWLDGGILLHERRPGLWIYRQTIPAEPEPLVRSLLVGLVRLGPAEGDASTPVSASSAEPRERDERLEVLRAMHADFEPCLLLTRAPLSGALSTTRQPDLTAEDGARVGHDAFRINDYAQHVELQGLVKNAEVMLAAGKPLWEAARDFERDPEAARLSGARYKLCAILDEESLRESRGTPLPDVALGLFGVSLEDPVY